MPRYDPGVLSRAAVVSGNWKLETGNCLRKRLRPQATAEGRRAQRGGEHKEAPPSEVKERYRSGRNGGASKASCRVSGTGVRIPPSPPTFAHACQGIVSYGWQAT